MSEAIKPNRQPRPGPLGNAPGLVLPRTLPRADAPGEQPETGAESAWDRIKRGAKDAAQYYKDNISESLHDFAGKAMETGGDVATAGGATMGAGVVVAATGVGAPVAAGMEAAGGATAAVGGVVAGVGGASESAATVMDQAAEMVITGQTPELVAPAVELAKRLLGGLILKRVPGAGAVAGKGKRDAKREPEKKGGGNQGTGGYNLGVGGPCIVGTYEQIKGKCGEGQQAHHIVPDTLNRTGNRVQGAKGIGRIPGMPSLGGGPAICLQGNAGTAGSEHNTAHQADSEIHEAAQRTDNGPVGTLPVSEAVPKTMSAAIAARPDCKEQIESQVRKAYPNYENDNRSMNGAGKPAAGDAKGHLDSGGTADNGGTTNRGRKRK